MYQKCIAVYQKCITVCVRSVSQCVRSVSEVVISRLTGEKAPKVPRSYQIMPDKCPKLWGRKINCVMRCSRLNSSV
ncbi:hypothetical protein, partial [uncultured Bacteroides sp.]|uniref:hypothetical protein n=1 Tax=uncultured Bacteroides sp. TaxID=162156 RepID=UPI002592E1C1